MMLIQLHSEIGLADRLVGSKKETKVGNSSLISHLRLKTAASHSEMKTFYHDLLGFPIVSTTNEEITFQAGESKVSFYRTDIPGQNPWYHFAFNIPENKLLKARLWQMKRSEIIPTPPRARDSRYPDDVRHFPRWNAHSLFFWDPAGNLLEYIARHDLNNGADGDFSTADILNISEIAFVVDDQQKEAKKLHHQLGLEAYPRNTSFWWSMGDENGLLLCIPRRIWGENTKDPRRFEVFETEAVIHGLDNTLLQFEGFPYQVKVVKSV